MESSEGVDRFVTLDFNVAADLFQRRNKCWLFSQILQVTIYVDTKDYMMMIAEAFCVKDDCDAIVINTKNVFILHSYRKVEYYWISVNSMPWECWAVLKESTDLISLK